MSSSDRQNRLLANQDWKRIYQSFRNAEFQSYDFDNLRRTMINYLRENYPEDFNDYIESSEYLALIDMIAYLGQNFAFRVDLNARENYLELAERRESVLRLARLLSYNPRRNRAANGLLKIESVSTSESVTDSSNVNLENQSIIWNDPANSNWREQFEIVLNVALPDNGRIGNPVKTDTVNGIPTEKYRFNATNTEPPVYQFSKTIDGRTNSFEVVSTDMENGSLREETPKPGRPLAFVYRNDGQGPGSSNTGYFSHFRQGVLDFGDFSITNPSTSETVSIDSKNINETDVWLYSLDNDNQESELWTRVDSVEGNNVIYNSLSKDIRNIYSVLTRVDDRISIIFSDGVFGNLPRGAFRAYYRTSANARIIISPADMRNISVRIPYTSRRGKSQTLTVNYSLKYTVDNATTSETSESIKTNAPATYYTQNRMVTAEDYQISPLALSQEIIKARSVNRTSSGISRYFDLIDATGKYSNTNIFATDGVLYKDYVNIKQRFGFQTLTEIEGEILNTVEPIFRNEKLRNYYLSEFPRVQTGDLRQEWQQITVDTNQTTGFFLNSNQVRTQVGDFTASNMRFVRPESLLKFQSPEGFYFLDGKLQEGQPDFRGGTRFVWTKVVSVLRDGTELTEQATGPVVLNDKIPTGSKLVTVIPAIPGRFTDDVRAQAINQIFAYNTFGIRYDRVDGEWKIVSGSNLDTVSPFSTGKSGDTSGENLDASWLLLFETNGVTYTITYRGLRYVFESNEEIRFFFDSIDKTVDPFTGKTIKDTIKVLGINSEPDNTEPFKRDFDWQIAREYRDREGYVNSKKVELDFFDSDDDGIIDNPDIFEEIVDTQTNPRSKYIVLKRQRSEDGVTDFVYAPDVLNQLLVFENKESVESTALSQYNDNQLFYFIEENIFERFNKQLFTFEIETEFRAQKGRDRLRFQYEHSADQNQRIDPSASNIVDTYLLTQGYDTLFRDWLSGTTEIKPLPPSTDELFLSYGSQLNQIKTVSDEIIYHPVKYKVLFGNKAEPDLQAQFKIVKNPELVLNDNELKSRVIAAINRFFALENWDFGDRFFFSEMSLYVMNELSPDLVTFVIVPEQAGQTFGSLYEIKSEADEIFISGATVNDIDIIDEITAARLNASGTVLTETAQQNIGIQSTNYDIGTSGGLNTDG